MSPRPALTRLAIAGAAGALVCAAAVTPATAGVEGGSTGGHRVGGHAPRLYKGVVTARQLLLRSEPNRGGRVIRVALKGDVVTVYCKQTGQRVDGNPWWYRLTDGAWAWGSARHIRDLGPSPRRC
ncbi:SH3 domain-containing protein [Streptomyces sp. NPDC017936]|uniref:SH3 domain-containing protein n=1 Tax=Streptomyces sp. NPDC017936 TaxID=3365016 RepID=UPI00379779F0